MRVIFWPQQTFVIQIAGVKGLISGVFDLCALHVLCMFLSVCVFVCVGPILSCFISILS